MAQAIHDTNVSAEKLALDEHELFLRQRAVKNAIATQRLEGLEVSAETVIELERCARGKLEITDVIRHIRERIAAGYYRDHNLPTAKEHIVNGAAR